MISDRLTETLGAMILCAQRAGLPTWDPGKADHLAGLKAIGLEEPPKEKPPKRI